MYFICLRMKLRWMLSKHFVFVGSFEKQKEERHLLGTNLRFRRSFEPIYKGHCPSSVACCKIPNSKYPKSHRAGTGKNESKFIVLFLSSEMGSQWNRELDRNKFKKSEVVSVLTACPLAMHASTDTMAIINAQMTIRTKEINFDIIVMIALIYTEYVLRSRLLAFLYWFSLPYFHRVHNLIWNSGFSLISFLIAVSEYFITKKKKQIIMCKVIGLNWVHVFL